MIPTRNRCSLLAETLATVLGQRDVSFEVVVVDDASDDGTAAFLDGVGDPRLRVERFTAPGGVANARNRGLQVAGGEWVAFTDDDDLWAPDKLAAQVDALGRHPESRWVSGEAIIVDDDLEVIGALPFHVAGQADLSDTLLGQNVIPGGASGVLAARSLLDEVGGFDPRFSLLADWDLWIRLALRSPVAAVSRPLHAYRVHAGAMSTTSHRDVATEIDLVDAKYRSVRARRGVSVQRDALAFWTADRCQRAGRRREASEAYLLAGPNIGWFKASVFSAGAMAWPGSIRYWDRRRGRAVPGWWLDDVASWLPAARANNGDLKGLRTAQ